MQDFRGILAALCAGVGLLLIVVSIWRSSSRQKKSAMLTWIYAALFCVVGVVLWRRGEHDTAIVEPKTEPRREVKQEVTSIVPADSLAKTPLSKMLPNEVSAPPAASPKTVQSESVALNESVVTNKIQNSESPWGESGDSPPRPSSAVPQVSAPITSKSLPEVQPHSKRDWRDAVEWQPEEVQNDIYQAVDHAFSWVNRFFDKYGSEATQRPDIAVTNSAPRRNTIREMPHFPSVNFYVGTSELTGDSQSGLRQLAVELRSRSDLAALEIQARVDSMGPEAFNFILTEARAATVRDFLVSEGVSAELILARGVGSSVLDAPKENSDVQFVVRR